MINQLKLMYVCAALSLPLLFPNACPAQTDMKPPHRMQKLLPDDALGSWPEHQFGASVSISEDGNTVLIGAPTDGCPDGPYPGAVYAYCGAAYVYRLKGWRWEREARLTANDGAAGDWFGGSVSLSDDGNTALIGAYGDDGNGDYTGSAYVFVRGENNEWTQQKKFTPDDSPVEDEFGASVSLDGDTAVVGCPGEDTHKGAAYVFVSIDGRWEQQQKLTADNNAPYYYTYFGRSVSLDGDTVLIGSEDATAYVFVRIDGRWEQQQKLTGSVGNYFGRSVSLDGDTALIGAPSEDDKGENSGSAYIFVRNNDTWTLQQKILADDGAAGDWFGFSVSLNKNAALVGARYDDNDNGEDAGSAYLFGLQQGGKWEKQWKYTAPDGAVGDIFGNSVSLNGNTAMVGAPWDDDKGEYTGSVYAFSRNVGWLPAIYWLLLLRH